MSEIAQAALAQFGISGQLAPLGQGHIHDTYLVQAPAGAQYVLQRVNEYVFKDGDLLMAQTARVLQCWAQQQRYQTPQLQTTVTGDEAVRVDGLLWRMWHYLDDSKVIDPLTDETRVLQVAQAFAAFQQQMEHLPEPALEDTIAGFLQLPHYLDAYQEVRQQAPAELDNLIQQGSKLADQFRHRTCIIHADCKVNNVLFDQKGTQVIAVIDFDTVMHGHWAWDFGDLVRSVCFSVRQVREDLFAACARGFAARADGDAAALADAPAYLAMMLGLRFLTDHLSGDQYFKVNSPGQNLQRAQQQFALYRQFVERRGRLVAIAQSQLAQV